MQYVIKTHTGEIVTWFTRYVDAWQALARSGNGEQLFIETEKQEIKK